MVFEKICWAITLLATCMAALTFFTTVTTAAGAPQQAAGAAMAAAICIIPYVFTRAVEGIGRPEVARVQISPIGTAPVKKSPEAIEPIAT